VSDGLHPPRGASPRIKARLDDLAVLGGPRTFPEPLHVGRPNVGDRERLRRRLEDLLDRRWLTNDGPYVQELERRLADLLDVPHCIAVCNATVALGIAARALGLTGEVVVPGFTFVGTAHALAWIGLEPVFCDVDARSHCIDLRSAERHVTARTSAILGVHLWGRPCDVEGLEAVCARRGLRLIFDAAHALACSHRGRPIGGFGDVEVFSFHATKFVNAFEGGAVTTRDAGLARRMRLMRNFGFADYDTVVELGTNGKMSEPSAAMAITSLESLEEFVAVNRANHERYAAALAGTPGLALLGPAAGERWNYQYVVVEVDEDAAGLTRDDLHRVLWAENVLARRYFHPGCHVMAPYRGAPSVSLPVTDRLARSVLCLPTGTAVGGPEIDAIGAVLRVAAAHAGDVRSRLAASTPSGRAAAGGAAP
jgi:dTDP-4-amino-4,6-dideoxygalactose transaminase